MGGEIFFLVIAFVVFLALEFAMIGAFQLSSSTRTKKVLGSLCRVVLGICIIGYLLLVALFLFVGIDLILNGERSRGVSLLFSAMVMAVCVYIWLIRGWIKKIRKMKE